MDMTFDRQLNTWRTSQNLSQVQLAKRAGLTQAYVVRLESGQSDPSLSVLRRLAAALSIPLGQLIDEAPPAAQLDRHELDQLARSVYHPHSRANKNQPTVRLLARAFQGRRAALGLLRPRAGKLHAAQRVPSSAHAVRKLKAILGDQQWQALLQRIDKHAPFQGPQ
jgi:transcriptional regulator with XRE-family HTH domain